jgi:hypothetical protein
MNTRTNWLMLLAAVGLGAYVFLVDRKAGMSVRSGSGETTMYAPVEVASVTAVDVARSNLVMRAEVEEGVWRMTLPLVYPAQSASIQRFLDQISRLLPTGYVTASEVGAQPEGLKAFGLEPPMATVGLTTLTVPVTLRLGGPSPQPGRFYFQRVGTDGVFTADASILGVLPESANDWRDRTLLDLGGRAFDRITLAGRGRTVFDAVRDVGGRWRLRQPVSARADGERLEALVATLQTVQATGFVSDALVIDRAAYGLQPPELELAVGAGTNDIVRIQVGSWDTNHPGQRFVRRLSHTNLVRVASSDLAILDQPLDQFRDLLLLGLLEGVTRLELRGTNGFEVERAGTNWMVTTPTAFPADNATVDFLISHLGTLEIVSFVNDVVPSLEPYGLVTPTREFLAWRGTNVLAHLQVGGPANPERTLLYARRLDEAGVYAISRTVLFNLETAAQLRSWRFDPKQVVTIRVEHEGRNRVLTREGAGWKVTEGEVGELIPDAVEESLYRLGEWNSMRYAVADEAALLRDGRFGAVRHEVVLTLNEVAPMTRLRLRFGASLGLSRIVLANFDDEPAGLRLELPEALYEGLVRYLGLP